MEKIIDNIHIKRIGYFNLYLIKGKNGDILIDTGFICMKKIIKKWLDQHNVKLIILTHAHVDHIWNTKYIQDLYNCKVAISKSDIKYIDNKKIKTKSLNKISKYWAKLMQYGMNRFEAEPFDITYKLQDKDTINKYGIKLTIHKLPGHTKGSIGIKYKNYLFAGDALVNRIKVTRAYQNQQPKQSKRTVQKIKHLSPDIIFLGHDKYITKEKFQKDIK